MGKRKKGPMKAPLRRTTKLCPVKGCRSRLFEDHHDNYQCLRCRRRFKKKTNLFTHNNPFAINS